MLSVMPPPDPFTMLGLEPRFDLDSAEIDRAFLARAASAHPDLAGSDGSMSALNEARRILAEPERRANALLALLGGPSPEQCRDLPQGFLMEIMELRERIEDLLAGGDASVRASVEREARARRDACVRAVAEAFASLGDPPDPTALRDIRVQLNAWRYIERLIEQLGD